MKKTIIAFIIILFNSFLIFSNEIYCFPFSDDYKGPNYNYLDYKVFPFYIQDQNYLYIYKQMFSKDIIIANNIPNNKKYIKISKDKLIINKNGFKEISLNDFNYVIIDGAFLTSNYPSEYYVNDINNAIVFYRNIYLSQLNNDYFNNIIQNQNTDESKMYFKYNCDGFLEWGNFNKSSISKVTMNYPYLSEKIDGKTIIYDDDFLQNRWYWYFYNEIYVNCNKPMVEGDVGNGTGLEVNIDFKTPVNNIVVLNGYVDLDKQHLYKKNARMKKVIIKGDNFTFDYEFEDYVHFSQIKFPEQTTNIKIFVIEVYEGEKWDDLAISGLWVKEDVTKDSNSKVAQEYLDYANENSIELIK